MKNNTKSKIPYFSFKKLDKLGFVNAFTSRNADENNHELKLYWNGETGKDERWGSLTEIKQNLDKIANELGHKRENIVECIQKHTNNVAVVSLSDIGKNLDKNTIQNTDGLVTNEDKILLSVNVADCASVFFADPVQNAIGLCHSGRKGTLNVISRKIIEKMKAEFGTNAKDLIACVGPTICAKCYEVGDEIYQEFLNSKFWNNEKCKKIFYRDKISNKFHLDLRTAIKITLRECGILEKNIEISRFCTCCKSKTFYSYRSGKMESENRALLGLPLQK